MNTLQVTNVNDGETVHQSCILLTGTCPDTSPGSDNHITIRNTDALRSTSSNQAWPATDGKWKALILLRCGSNNITIKHGTESIDLLLTHQPLLQLPPLHLAILVAKDSPLIINCPAEKYGAFSTTHNSLGAAIAKLRMTAYMWQALTAERMREQGFGRRVFRLEEEWQSDVTTLPGLVKEAKGEPIMGSVAKVHVVRCEKTVEELGAMSERHWGRANVLHDAFLAALKSHGGVFQLKCRPVVAGLVLDSPRWENHDKLFSHATSLIGVTQGISLGILDSHLTYSWPRFLEEVATCLTDKTVPDTEAYGAKYSMSEHCALSQAMFLQEVLHAFGATEEHRASFTSVQVKGWAANFTVAGESSWEMVEDSEPYDAALRTSLQIKAAPHFRLPNDTQSCAVVTAGQGAKIRVSKCEAEDNEDDGVITVASTAGLASVFFRHGCQAQRFDMRAENPNEFVLDMGELVGYDRKHPLKIVAMDVTGAVKTVANGWRLFQTIPYINFSAGKHRLRLQSYPPIEDGDIDPHEDQGTSWTVLLHKHSGLSGPIRATAIDLRVGCCLDGAVIYYADGTTQNCGPPHDLGGHASEKGSLPVEARIVKVELCIQFGWPRGIRMTLDNGTQWGTLSEEDDYEFQNGNADDEQCNQIVVLEPGAGEKIIGFSGRSDPYVQRFGIITAPFEVDISDISVQTV